MANAVDICNQALIHVGQTQFLSALTDPTETGRVCAVVYPQARDYVLSALPWPFAKKEAILAQLSNTTRSGWAFCYALPSDFLHARYIFTGLRPGAAFVANSVMGGILETSAGFRPAPGWSGKVPFELQLSDDGTQQILCSDYAAPTLVYTASQAGSAGTQYPPPFVDCLAYLLAVRLASAILKKPSMADAMDKRFRLALMQAGATVLNGQTEDREPDAEAVSVRG